MLQARALLMMMIIPLLILHVRSKHCNHHHYHCCFHHCYLYRYFCGPGGEFFQWAGLPIFYYFREWAEKVPSSKMFKEYPFFLRQTITTTITPPTQQQQQQHTDTHTDWYRYRIDPAPITISCLLQYWVQIWYEVGQIPQDHKLKPPYISCPAGAS